MRLCEEYDNFDESKIIDFTRYETELKKPHILGE